MVKKKPTKKAPAEPPMETGCKTPKYQHPKILLMDTAPEIAEALKEEGYNTSTGTFGTPYKVSKESGYQPVVMNASLPNYITEQEIIVVDLVPKDSESGPPGEKMTPMKELDWWAKCNHGEIDPRPRAMDEVQGKFDRILNNGGAFIVFSDSRDRRDLVHASDSGGYNGFSIAQEIPCDNWSFLPVLSNLAIDDENGEEIQAVEQESPMTKLLASHLDNATFRCTFYEAQRSIKKRWDVLAKNKYEAAVAGVIVPPDKSKSGWIFVLPQIKEKALFLSAVLKNILPDLSPGLFPHAEGQKWVRRPEYELPSVLDKDKQISDIQDDAANKVSDLEKAIEDDRNASQFLYDLIRETGDPLVQAVQEALALLGFASVVDVDAEMKNTGKDASLREDLRIHDKSPVLVVDIKGVTGKPADDDARQAQKHASFHIQEQKSIHFRGLTIINHQRHLPPLERENDMLYRQEILNNAKQLHFGLMTGWDMFRLVRGFIQNNWKPQQVIPLFYQTGRILPIPCHYEFVGKVKQVWKRKNAFSIQIEDGEIRIGDSLAVEFPVDFHEQKLASLQLDNKNVELATANCEVGVQREESLPKVKPGMPVYRITP